MRFAKIAPTASLQTNSPASHSKRLKVSKILGELDKYLAEIPISGKTYSLFGATDDTWEFHSRLERFTDSLLAQEPDIDYLLYALRFLSGKKRPLKKLSLSPDDGSLIQYLIKNANRDFSLYTQNTPEHLKSLAILKRLHDPTLATSREQYHLYMIEIELVNRRYKETFRKCETKIALLPHCLRFSLDKCRAEKEELDLVCKGCVKNCFVNQVSTILREHNIRPYIWMTADLKDFFRHLRREGGSLGVLGIACVAELVRGMRRCIKIKAPVVGIPLNANRCARWMGEWHPTSVSVNKLASLVKVKG